MEFILWPPIILGQGEVKNIAASSYIFILQYMVAVSARIEKVSVTMVDHLLFSNFFVPYFVVLFC